MSIKGVPKRTGTLMFDFGRVACSFWDAIAWSFWDAIAGSFWDTL